MRPPSSPRARNRQSSIDAPPLPRCDISNTTLSLHRASALFARQERLSRSGLKDLEQRLRDILVGDVVRGIEVGLDGGSDSAMGSAGPLEAVTIEWVDAHGMVATSKPALQVTLQYESALCLAVLLPAPDAAELPDLSTGNDKVVDGSLLHLPLLLLRMPATLKSIVVEFISDTFDCRIRPMRLSSKDIIRSWELWVRETAVPTRGPLAKGAVLTLAFNLPESRHALHIIKGDGMGNSGASIFDPTYLTTPGVKTIDIFVPNEDLRGFLTAGRQLTPGTPDKQQWTENNSTPFTDAISHYVKHHLALDMTNPAVGIVRVACGGFVLSESRLKIFGIPEGRLDMYSNRHRATVPQLLGSLAIRARD